MSNNPGSGPQGIISGIENLFNVNKIMDNIKHSTILNKSIHSGVSNVPYAFMALVTVVAGTFTYVTYRDYSDEINENLTNTIESVQSSDMFNNENTPVNTDNLFEQNEGETTEEDPEEATQENPEEPTEEKPEEPTEEKPEEKSEDKKGGKTRRKRKNNKNSKKKR